MAKRKGSVSKMRLKTHRPHRYHGVLAKAMAFVGAVASCHDANANLDESEQRELRRLSNIIEKVYIENAWSADSREIIESLIAKDERKTRLLMREREIRLLMEKRIAEPREVKHKTTQGGSPGWSTGKEKDESELLDFALGQSGEDFQSERLSNPITSSRFKTRRKIRLRDYSMDVQKDPDSESKGERESQISEDMREEKSSTVLSQDLAQLRGLGQDNDSVTSAGSQDDAGNNDAREDSVGDHEEYPLRIERQLGGTLIQRGGIPQREWSSSRGVGGKSKKVAAQSPTGGSGRNWYYVRDDGQFVDTGVDCGRRIRGLGGYVYYSDDYNAPGSGVSGKSNKSGKGYQSGELAEGGKTGKTGAGGNNAKAFKCMPSSSPASPTAPTPPSPAPFPSSSMVPTSGSNTLCLDGCQDCSPDSPLPCPRSDLKAVCDKHNDELYPPGSPKEGTRVANFIDCYDMCKPSFCCIHDSLSETYSPTCAHEYLNCPLYYPCYIIWWKLHDTIGPATYLRVEQDEPFYNVDFDYLAEDFTEDQDFFQQLFGHHFDGDDAPTDDTFEDEENW